MLKSHCPVTTRALAAPRRAIPALLLALGLALPAVPADAQMRGGNHAAIAFSPSIYGVGGDTAAPGVGRSWGWLSAREARSAALLECHNNDPIVTDCRVVVAITRGCAALAVGTRGVTAVSGTGRGASVRAASAAAMQACGRNGQRCRVATTTCARSRDRP